MEEKSGRYPYGAEFKEKTVTLTNVDLDALTDVAITLNDVVTRENNSREMIKGQCQEALGILEQFFARRKIF